MKTVTRFGLAAGLAGALALFGSAHAQQDTKVGPAGSGTGSGAPDSVGQGDTGRSGTSPSSGGSMGGSSETGSKPSTPSSDSASGGAGASASASDTATGAPSAGTKIDQRLQDRLEKIHAGHLAEIQMGQMAQTNAQSPDVKQYAQRQQTDHMTMDQALTQQAQTMGVSLEGKTFQKEQQSATKEMQSIEAKTGAAFDKAYMSRMVKDHERDLNEAKSAVKEAQKKDPELAFALQSAAGKIQSHLTEAKQVEKSLGQKGQAKTGSSSGTGSSGMEPHSGSRGDTGGPAPTGTTPGGSDTGGTKDTGTK